MQQMNEVYNFIDFRNQTRATIERLRRIDTKDYPEIAIREALLNLLVHRDYSFSASALISIYADSAAGAEKGLSDEEKVLEYTRSHGAITRNDVIELLGVSTSTASRVIRRMVKSNLLKQNGKARSTKYTIL